MLAARFTLASTLLLGALAVHPTAAQGETARQTARQTAHQTVRRVAQGDASSRAVLAAERQRVRAELERANAEIDTLKRSGRGLREDYRLRERLADAEALARRLTELDTRLGATGAPAARGPGAAPSVSSADGPAELDAKADIIADQAQRLAARGDLLLGRARDLRARQTLRRRVGQMERDPFSPLEGSKRRAMTGSVAVGGATSGGTGAGAGTTRPSTPVIAMGNEKNPNTPPPTGGAATDVSSPAPGTAVPALGPSTTGAASPGPPQAAQVGAAAVSSPTSPPAPTSGAASDVTALSVQLRELLDPTTLAEIQHLEATGGATTSYEALERAGAALKTRAERLRQQAAALRASEHAPPRGR